jgi:hypothetical protein
MRAAMVGGAGYAVGKRAQRGQTQEYEQEQRLSQLEQQQAYAQPAAAPPPPPAPPPAAAPPAPQTDMVGQLKQLSDLKAAGALTDEEFEAAKQKLLAG